MSLAIKKALLDRKLPKTYIRGFGKAMDITNEVDIFWDIKSASIKRAWENVGSTMQKTLDEFSAKNHKPIKYYG